MKTKFIKLCKKLSTYSDHHQHKMAALVIKRGKLISMGWNSLKTHPKSNHEYKMVHAEFKAINRVADRDLDGASVFVFRQLRNGTLANAKPCESCLSLIIEKNISKIFYTDEGGIREISFNRFKW